jgi:hypothetical protein
MKWFLYGVMMLVLASCAGQATAPVSQAPPTPTALAVVEPTAPGDSRGNRHA